MIQLVAVGLIGALGWYAWKSFRKEMARVDREVTDVRRKQPTKTLELDPKTGRYRESKDE